MDLAGDVYGLLGVTGPLYLTLGTVVAVLLGFSLSFAFIEALRIYREYAPGEETYAHVIEQAEKPPELMEKLDITKLPQVPARTAIPAVDVVKDTLPESMKAITGKYGLESLTLATLDGLAIASNHRAPDEDAAVYSNLFQALYLSRPGPYFHLANKDIHLFLVESGEHNVIGIAKKPGKMAQDEVASLRDDGRKIIDRFASGGRRN